MCVAVPGRVVTVGPRTDVSIPGVVVVDGVDRPIDLVLVPDVGPGDYVTTHSGFAIHRLDPADAEATLALFDGAAGLR